MSDLVRVHNPNPFQVIYSSDGRQVDGHSSVLADPTDPLTEKLLNTGQLLIPAEPKPRLPIPKPKPKTVKEESSNE